MRLVLFDCDGTLVDSVGLIHEVMARTFVDFGHARPDVTETKAIIGLTLDIAIARMQGKPHVDDEALAMTAHYKDDLWRRACRGRLPGAAFPRHRRPDGAAGTRGGPHPRRRHGKSRRGLDLIRASHGFEKTFFVSRTADDCPSKPHPGMVTECCSEAGIDAAATVVVGDAIYDMQMAKAAGAKAVGVAWGYASVPELVEAGADHILRTPADLLDWLEISDA
jgi:phosphoglycolate phosphatase